jgi:hypothetical protein
MTKRGLYLLYDSTTNFLPILKISVLVKNISKVVELTPEKIEKLESELYALVANYKITEEYCWLSVVKSKKDYTLKWGTSPIIKSAGMSNEAIAAVYYVWKQSSCTPEEACKVLNIGLNTLMDLSAQFELNHGPN